MRLRTGVLLLGCALVLVATSVTWAKPGSIFIPLGGTVSALLPDPSAPLIYVADQDNNRVLFIATEMGPTMTAVAVGPRPVGLALDPDGTTLYVAEQDSGTIGVIDVASAQRVGSINVGVPPQAIATGRPGRLYVVGMDDQAFMTDDLRIFDTTTGNLLGTFFTDYFYFPSVAMSPDGNTLFVLSSSVGVVAVDVSTDTPSLGPSVSIAPAYRDLWVNWHGNKLFVGNRIYDLPALTLSGQLSIGATTVTTSPSDRTIVSGNSFDPTIYFWRESSLSEYGTFTLLGGTNFVRILPYDGTIISAPGGGVELDMIHKVH